MTSENRLMYVADALLGCAVLRGPVIGTGSDIDPEGLNSVDVSLSVGENLVSAGDSKNNPCDSVVGSLTALANELCVERKVLGGLKAGAFVIAGHCCQVSFGGRTAPNLPPKDPAPKEWGEVTDWKGLVLRADFDGYGSVGCIINE